MHECMQPFDKRDLLRCKRDLCLLRMSACMPCACMPSHPRSLPSLSNPPPLTPSLPPSLCLPILFLSRMQPLPVRGRSYGCAQCTFGNAPTTNTKESMEQRRSSVARRRWHIRRRLHITQAPLAYQAPLALLKLWGKFPACPARQA